MDDERNHERERSRGSGFEWYFIGLVTAVIPGVALVFFGLDYAADNITALAIGFLGTIFGVAFAGGVLYLFRHRIMGWVRVKADTTLHDVADAVENLARVAHPGSSPDERIEAVGSFGHSFASWFSWVSTRRWVAGLTITLFIGFGALVGEVILFRQLEIAEKQLAKQTEQVLLATRQLQISEGQLEATRGQLEALGFQIDQARLQNELVRDQNGLIKAQNQYFREQNERTQLQIDAQAADTRIVRRAQLLTTIYELSDCDRSKLEEGEECPPKAPSRLREEAVRALAQLDEENLNLSGSDLSGARLLVASLQYARFQSANLRNIILSDSNLTDATLINTDLSYAYLTYVDLSDSDLSGANLSGAYLYDTNLSGADLTGANLSYAILMGAKLREAKNLTKPQLAEACGDSRTQIPEELERPDHWLDRPWKRSDPEGAGCPPEPTE